MEQRSYSPSGENIEEDRLLMVKRYYPFIIFLVVSLVPFWINVSDVSVDGVLNLRDFDTPVEIVYDLYVRFFTWYSNWGLGMSNPGSFVLLNKSLVFYLFGLLNIPLIYIEKIYLTIVLFLLGCGSYYFVTHYFILKNVRIVGLLSGLFYMFSVPVYTRLIGVPHILISIALWPVLFMLLLKVVYSENRAGLLKYSAYFAVVAAFALSADLSLNLIYTITITTLLLWHVIVDRRKISFSRALFGISLVFLATVLVSLWWCVPILLGIFDGSLVEGNIAHHHNAEVFAAADNTVSLFDNIRLHWTKGGFGLLAPDGTPYFNPSYIKDYYNSTVSYVVFLIFFGASVFASFINKENKTRVYILALIGLIATFFSLGTHFPVFGDIHRFLFDNVPGFQALRNFHKFQYIILIWYVSLFALLCDYLFYRFRESRIKFAVVLLSMLGFIIQSGLPFTAKNLAGRHEYFIVPHYYNQARAWLDAENEDIYRVLVMPQGTWEETYDWGPKFELVPLHRNFFKNSTLILQEPDEVRALIKPIEEYRIGNLKEYLKLMNVRYVMIRKDIYKPNLTDKNSALIMDLPWVLKAEGIEHVKSFGKLDLYKVPDGYVRPHIYPAAVSSTMVVGQVDSLTPLSHTTYINGRNVLAFTGQQNEAVFLSLVDGLESSPGGQVLFVNGEFRDQVLEFIRTESLRDGRSFGADSSHSAFVSLDDDARGEVNVEEDGSYEVWIRSGTGAGVPEEIDLVIIDGGYHVLKDDGAGRRWLMVGVMELKKGRHSISVGGKRRGSIAPLEAAIIPEGRRNEYYRLFDSKDKRYFFHGVGDERSKVMGARMRLERSFHISKAGEYEVSTFLKPKIHDAAAYAVREVFDGRRLGAWEFRTAGGRQEAAAGSRSGNKGEWTDAMTPVFIFGNNFYPPTPLFYPSIGGMWRRLTNDGVVLIFNPGNEEITADISFSMVSFKRKRRFSAAIGSRVLKKFTIDGPDRNKTGKSAAGGLFGKPQSVELKGVALIPGINKMVLSSDSPPEQVVGENFVASAAVGDNFRVEPSGRAPTAVSFNNGRGFEWRVVEEGLQLKDNYSRDDDEVAWVSRSVDSIDLHDYPIVTMDYTWPEDSVQTMEVGFRVDTDGDGKGDLFITRPLEDALYSLNRFKIDLLEEMMRTFPESDKVLLVGIDLFLHKKWGLDPAELIVEEGYSYIVKEISVVSKKATWIMAADEDSFEKIELSEDLISNQGAVKDSSGLVVSLPLGGQEGSAKRVELIVPLKEELKKSATHILLPFRISDTDVQSIKLMVGLDVSGDGKAERFVPLGERVLLDNWKPLEGMRAAAEEVENGAGIRRQFYECYLPRDFLKIYVADGRKLNNIVVLKSGSPLAFTGDDERRVSRDHLSLEGGRVIISLPLDVDPGEFTYELYYLPEGWTENSPRFTGFFRYTLNLSELKYHLHKKRGAPVALKFILEGKLPGNIGDRDQAKFYNFYLKAPVYATPVVLKVENIPLKDGMPDLHIDSEKIELDGGSLERSGNIMQLKTKVWLDEGLHHLVINETGALELLLAEIKLPLYRGESVVDSESRLPEIGFKKLNPTRYVVEVGEVKGPFTLVFSERFNAGWKAYLREPSARNAGGRFVADKEPWSALWNSWRDRDRRIEIKDHFVANGYGNGWIVPAELIAEQSGTAVSQIVLEYEPQKFFEIGILVSATTLLGATFFLGYVFVVRKRKEG